MICAINSLLLVFVSCLLVCRQVNNNPMARPGKMANRHANHPHTPMPLVRKKTHMPNYRRDLIDHPYLNIRIYEIGTPGQYAQTNATFKTVQTTTGKVVLNNDCDYVIYYCMRGYKTGVVCGKTVYHTYTNFENFCQMDYVNCIEGYDVWTVAYMGACINITVYDSFSYYGYGIWDDRELDEMYA